jgi:hypothetical protein
MWRSVDWRLTTEIISLILAVVALAIGVYHLVEIRRASKSLSTRYIGKFPFFLPQIVEVLASARHEIVIFCDFPGYGDFSDPPNALEYRQVIEKQLQHGVAVELTCMSEENRKKYSTEQLTEAQWKEWLKNPVNKARATAFMSTHGANVVDPETLTFNQLSEAMESVDRRILAQVFRDRAAQLPIDMPIYFWIADARSAVFSIPALSDEAQEYGFRTSDHALIQALLEIRQRFRRKFASREAAKITTQTA